MSLSFPEIFKRLSRVDGSPGYEPFRWQRRLYDRLCDALPPTALDLPTGLGKTSAMIVWLGRSRRQS